MEMIRTVVEQGRQAIVLIPEIALTYQTVMRFYRRFGDRVAIMNSRLSAGERYDQMMRARAGQVDVMIGPRSALFTPFPNLGLIVIDEEHEPTYKSEQTPRYHARETAIRRAQTEDAGLVLGSATPSMEAMYRARCGEYVLFEMKKPFPDAADGAGIYGRYAGRIKEREPLCFKPEAYGADGGAAREGRADHAFPEPPRLFGVHFL